jgi:hypothetical protein
MKRHKEWSVASASRAPSRGYPTSSCFVSESQMGCFLHTHLCGLASSHPGFPTRDYSGKSLETTWPGFDQADGGVMSPCLIHWIGTCSSWLSPTNDDPSSTQILTRHCGARSQTVIQLRNSGTTPTLEVLVV